MEKDIILSDEQQEFIDKAKQGQNILVDACIGSGKTTAIQKLCCDLPEKNHILYLTYNRLLKLDAKSKIKNKNVFVTNYHGFAYYYLKKNNISSGMPELIQVFNSKKPELDIYDILIIDEYQDIELEFAEMLEYIKSTNPKMQIIAVGDVDQKIYDKTSLDVINFIDKFLENYIKLQFTKCFRLSSDLAGMLGRVWNKKIIGVNNNCIVEQMNLDKVIKFLSDKEPKDILCLGSRTGDLSITLNTLESYFPDKFNKKTVYASIRDNDGENAKPKNTSAIFTTFDSSKGLERKICVVFDFTESYWIIRIKQPLQSYEILRNIFCVAASRGKERIIFVNQNEEFLSEKTLSERIETNYTFRDVDISTMFDFRYQEDIEKCYDSLKIEPLYYDEYNEIYIKNNDELIDLSPCIGIYQEAEFFENYNIDKYIEFLRQFYAKSEKYDEILKEKSLEKKILFLVSEDTCQMRYRTQVNVPFISNESRMKINERLSGVFSKDEKVQVQGEIPFYDEDGNKIFTAKGIADVVKEDTVYELKFVSELKHSYFLQCACYMIALNLNKGVLFNTKNNKAYRITIPDIDNFLNLVTNTITKGHLKKYYSLDLQSRCNTRVLKFALVDIETNFNNEVMSIGIVIADAESFHEIEAKYYIITPEYKLGGVFSNALYIKGRKPDIVGSRKQIFANIENILQKHNVKSIFAYNASFDFKHLPELADYNWYDIMKVAAYKQYNSKITEDMECYSTGRLKRDYGVDNIMRMLTGNQSYCETHNALFDALDELSIIRLIGRKYSNYGCALYNAKSSFNELNLKLNLCDPDTKNNIDRPESITEKVSEITNENIAYEDADRQVKSTDNESNRQSFSKKKNNIMSFFKKFFNIITK